MQLMGLSHEWKRRRREILELFDLQSYGVPQIVFTMAGYVVVACAAIGLSAKITKQ